MGALVLNCSACSFGMNDGSHIYIYFYGGLDVLISPVPKHFTVLLLNLSLLVFSESVGGGEGIWVSSVLTNH